jgi:hypothetical protein
MYWPLGTPKVYATNINVTSTSIQHTHDSARNSLDISAGEPAAFHDVADSSSPGLHADNPDDLPPKTPITPVTPAIRSVDDDELGEVLPRWPAGLADGAIAAKLNEAVLSLKVSRNGHMFVVATATTMTVWQTKVSVLPSPLQFSRSDEDDANANPYLSLLSFWR